MARKIKTFTTDLWVDADTQGNEESAARAKLLHGMILDYNILTKIGFSDKVRKGKYDIEEIYDIVKSNFAGLCDDKCYEDKGYKNAPKWKHVVRCALQTLKERGVIRGKGMEIGVWYFNGKYKVSN